MAAARILSLSVLLFGLSGCNDKPEPAPPAPESTALPLPPGVPVPVPPAPGAPDDGKRWIQKSLVGIGPKAKLDVCVPKAVASLPALALAPVDVIADKGVITLYTSLAASYPGLLITITGSDHATADIEFVGHGFREPDEARQAIAPQMRALANAITAACKG